MTAPTVALSPADVNGDTDVPDTRVNLTAVNRWLALVPGAILCASLAAGAVRVVSEAIAQLGLQHLIVKFLLDVVAAVVSVRVLVAAAAWIAPTHKPQVATFAAWSVVAFIGLSGFVGGASWGVGITVLLAGLVASSAVKRVQRRDQWV